MASEEFFSKKRSLAPIVVLMLRGISEMSKWREKKLKNFGPVAKQKRREILLPFLKN